MGQHQGVSSRDLPGQLDRIERRARRITDRYTWKRTLLFAALFIWLFNAYAAAPYIDGRSYIAIWIVACVGCWTTSGWLLDFPKLVFPDVAAFQHLRRPAPRDEQIDRA
jgi:hypothetical protein